MTFLIGTEEVHVDIPSKVLLDSVSIGVESGQRIGIVGSNGDGKSTLLGILGGIRQPDGGRVIANGNVRVSMLLQTDNLDDDEIVSRSVVGDADEYEWASDRRTREIIEGILEGIDWNAKISELSGGQRRRVDLARALVEDCDILMLDEPTNHLDMRAIAWLADHLKGRWRQGQGALLTVTHDRWFLDEVCNSMWEVHDAKVEQFEGGFSAYILQRVERQRLASLAEQKRQNLLRRELAWLSRGARARSTKPKFHVAQAKALIDDVPELRNTVELQRMALARIGKQVIDIEDAQVSYGSDPVLDGVNLSVGPGDRIAIIGENGAGKTTLLNLIRGIVFPSKGKVKIGSTVRVAVVSQHLDILAEYEDSLVRNVVDRFPYREMASGKVLTAAKVLESLGFDTQDMNEPVESLSGGQRKKLAIMMALLEGPNVLILDEPGNDLDIDMVAALEDLLDEWPGSLILITHDRYLTERVTDTQYALIDGTLRHLPRGIDEYLELESEARRQSAGATGDGPSQAGPAKGASTESPSVGQVASSSEDGDMPSITNSERRALKKLMSSNENKISTLEGKLSAAESELVQAEPTDHVELSRIQAQIDELKQRIDDLEEEWLEAAERISQ